MPHHPLLARGTEKVNEKEEVNEIRTAAVAAAAVAAAAAAAAAVAARKRKRTRVCRMFHPNVVDALVSW